MGKWERVEGNQASSVTCRKGNHFFPNFASPDIRQPLIGQAVPMPVATSGCMQENVQSRCGLFREKSMF